MIKTSQGGYRLGNKWEYKNTEISEYSCPCENGHYKFIQDTYWDDYVHYDYRNRKELNCNSCRQVYRFDDFGGLVRIVDYAKHQEARTKLFAYCGQLRKIAFAKYGDTMLRYVSMLPATKWHKLWEIPDSIETFRKYNRIEGTAKRFNSLLNYDSPSTIERILATLNAIPIYDKQINSMLPDFRALEKIEEDARKTKMQKDLGGTLIRKYTVYEKPA